MFVVVTPCDAADRFGVAFPLEGRDVVSDGVTEQVLHRTKRAILRPSKGAPALGRGSRGTASPLQSTRQSLVRNAVPARRGTTTKTKGDQSKVSLHFYVDKQKMPRLQNPLARWHRKQ